MTPLMAAGRRTELRGLQCISEQINKAADLETLLSSVLEALDGYTARARAATMLDGLGFATSDLERPVADFSGGWGVAYDTPEIRSAYGVAGPGVLGAIGERLLHDTVDRDPAVAVEALLRGAFGSPDKWQVGNFKALGDTLSRATPLTVAASRSQTSV